MKTTLLFSWLIYILVIIFIVCSMHCRISDVFSRFFVKQGKFAVPYSFHEKYAYVLFLIQQLDFVSQL